ncbi:baseplate J/gp47 family protein [Diaphorobacter caeni]|uniref:baseplate J/gp47 family protein n=1 Tax=Diaphorobacter caeni TaxID=2784387 RepID=UPI00188F0B2D|nr:baseplate J/gp47 family protein [Diaphorobacter caeni]MBF5003366.1 baseplate J/gp47 family protein [Diaphorobacter caeni]
MIDLQTLAPPSVVEKLSFETILAQGKADFADRMRPHQPGIDDILKLESDPVVKVTESFSLRELLIRDRINNAARAHLLGFAKGADLDHLAAMFGVERMAGESDDRFRVRLQLRIAALGAQGTREYYEYKALTASPLVRAARATQSAPGKVLVMLWVTDAAQAQAVRSVVNAALNADDARMLGVVLTVAVAVPHVINITARISRTRSAPGDLPQLLRKRLAAAFADMGIMAGTVARSYITTLLHVDGVHAVEFPDNAAPAVTTTIDAGEYPALGVVQLIDAGVIA